MSALNMHCMPVTGLDCLGLGSREWSLATAQSEQLTELLPLKSQQHMLLALHRRPLRA